MKYRTDITFGWLDLMVSFGGIAGLFLGCSVLSGIEIFYYLFLIFMTSVKKLKNHSKIFIGNNLRVDDIQSQNIRKRKGGKSEINVQTVKVISLTDIDTKVNKTRY